MQGAPHSALIMYLSSEDMHIFSYFIGDWWLCYWDPDVFDSLINTVEKKVKLLNLKQGGTKIWVISKAISAITEVRNFLYF